MADVFVGQIMMTGFNFPPRGFAACNGALLAIQQNTALFSLLGTLYGGDGMRTFALPDLRGRTPAGGYGSSDPSWQPPVYPQGAPVGVEQETLAPTELPQHSHSFGASTATATVANPLGGVFAKTVIQPSGSENIYVANGNLVPLAAQTIGSYGGSQPHENMQPSLVINFNIATSGVFPSRN